jgi:2-polyprenyl-3-methyl-5-hydroxy-6-metoxy-1,4-benzoquinol methylase
VTEYPYHSGEPTWDDLHLWAAVSRAITRELPPPRRICDLGCGNGHVAARLAALGYDVVGIDASESAVSWARSAFPQVAFHCASAYDALAPRLGTFPGVVSLEVIEHLYDPRRFARRCFELLEPAGILLMSTPYHGYLKNLALALAGRFDAHVAPLWDHGHIKFFSIETLSTLLREAGFVGLTFSRLGRMPVVAKTMLVVARKPASAPADDRAGSISSGAKG